MGSQLTSFNADIQPRATQPGLANANALAQTSNNNKGVSTLCQGAAGGYDQNQVQNVLVKIEELMHVLGR
jgi:hypothetical protein